MTAGREDEGAGLPQQEAPGAAADSERDRPIAEAYRRQVAENAELRSAATLGNRARVMATAAVIGIFLFVGGWSWMATQLNVRELDEVLGLQDGRGSATVQTMQVSQQPLTDAVNLTGTLEPGRVVNLVAPFQGQIRSIDFTYGERVDQGKVLLTLETADVEVQLRDAQTALIQAGQKLAEVKDWRSSTTVASAQRSLEQAQMSLGQAEQTYRSTKALFDKGIVSRQELDSAQATWRNAQVSVAGAREAVDAALKQGDKDAREVAQLAFENAQFKYDSLKGKMAKAVLKAPVSGIVLRPVATGGSTRGGSGGDGQASVTAGAPVSENQILLSIGDLETLAISSDVSEYNIGQIRPGLKVNVSSDALPGVTLQGEVTSVSSQASGGGGGGVPSFGTKVTVKDLSAKARREVRVGMSANLQVIIYQKPDAIVLPYSAVLGGPGDARVMVVPAAGAAPQPVKVELGERTATGIEIKSGLSPGQTVVTNASGATAQAGG